MKDKKQTAKEWRLNNPDRVKENRRKYAKEHQKEIKAKSQRDYELNREKIILKVKEWNIANAEHRKQYKKKYRETHKDQRNKVFNERMKNDVLFKLKHSIRSAILKSFKTYGYTKRSTTFQILGCTFNEFKQHIEQQFEPWMNWDNYGNWNGIPDKPEISWDFDHIVPLCTASNADDIKRLNHYSNLRPLCSYTNRYIKRDTHQLD
jgi:hypothetical protein